MDKDIETIQGLEQEDVPQVPNLPAGKAGKKSIGRTIWKWFRRTVLTIFIVIITALVALQLPIVQTWLAHQLTGYLKRKYDVEVKIDRLQINFFKKTVYLKEVYVYDHHKDTIVHAGIVKVDVKNIYPSKQYIDVKRIVVQDGYFHIRTYKGEQTPNLTQFINKLKGKNEKLKKKKGKLWVFNVSTLVLDECHMRIHNENQKVLDSDFLPSDIRVHGIAGKVGTFQVRGDTIEMDVENLQAYEESGLAMRKFSSHVIVSSKEITFKGFKLNTFKSSMGGYFSMRYRNWKSFSHFNDSIYMIADLDMSDINASDLAYFTNNLKGIDFDFRFKGGIAGTLSHLKGDGFAIYFGRITQMVGDIELIGLPNIDSTYFNFQVKKLITDAVDLAKIPIPPFKDKKTIMVPKEIQRLGIVKFNGNLKGYFSDMQIDGFATTKIGNADLNMHLYRKTKKDAYSYNGKIDAQHFNVGILTGIKEFGKVTFAGRLDGRGFNFKNGDSYVNFKGKISQLEFHGYNYKNITASAKFGDSMFEGIVDIADSNAKLSFVGTVNLKNKQVPVYDFTADIEKADLVALNVHKSNENSIISTSLTVNMKGRNVDDLVGQIRICGTDYLKGDKNYHVETFVLNSKINELDSTKTIDIHSDILNAKFSGKFKFIPLINEIKREINKVAPSAKMKIDEKIKYTPPDFYYYVVLSHPELLTQIFMPSLQISDGTTIEGRLGSKDNYFSMEINAGKIKFNRFTIDEFYFYARNKNDKLRIQSDAETFYFSDSTKIDNLNMSATAHNDSLDLWIGFQNEVANLNGASINIMTYFGDAPTYRFNIHDSYFYFNDSLWVMNDDNRIVLDKTSLTIENLTIQTAKDHKPLLTINGRSSENPEDYIKTTLNEFPLEIINGFLPSDRLKLKGEITGDVNSFRLLQKPFFTSSLGITNFQVNDMVLGALGIGSTYDPNSEEIDLNVYLVNEGKNILTIKDAKIRLKTGSNGFDIQAKIDGLDLSVLEKMVNPVFTNLHGKAYGTFSLTGTFKDPQIEAKINLKNAGLRLAYLNAYFNFAMLDKEIVVTNNLIKIPLIDLTDRYGNSGTVKGKVTHDLFQKIFLDVKLETKNMCVMETTEKNNEQFYGKAYATGKATVIGPMNDIIVAASMKTEKNTVLNIPIKSSKSVKQNNFIEFINPKDSIQGPITIEESRGNFTLDLNVKATPDATVRIIFDETVGDVITCQGYSEKINLTFDTKGRFTMLGTYEITKGDYLFTLQNIINKRFTVKPGSSISFTGNPYLAQVNATAIYRANASVYPIVASFMDPSQAELYRKATRVDCELTLTNTLSDLLLGFNLQLPSLDANAASIVKSALNTQEEMNRQVFALLVLNQFLPPESTGGGTNTSSSLISSGFGNTSLELLSGQLNNWLSKITKDVNINLNYKTGSQTNQDQVSVALSTQLFNERVIIDGDVGVGVGASKIQQSNNQIVGNVSVEVKVTKDGKLRLRAFNRSNDYNILKNSVDYTQGVGISYKVEFDNWADLFKRKNPKKKKEKKNKKNNNTTLENDSIK